MVLRAKRSFQTFNISSNLFKFDNLFFKKEPLETFICQSGFWISAKWKEAHAIRQEILAKVNLVKKQSSSKSGKTLHFFFAKWVHIVQAKQRSRSVKGFSSYRPDRQIDGHSGKRSFLVGSQEKTQKFSKVQASSWIKVVYTIVLWQYKRDVNPNCLSIWFHLFLISAMEGSL